MCLIGFYKSKLTHWRSIKIALFDYVIVLNKKSAQVEPILSRNLYDFWIFPSVKSTLISVQVVFLLFII